MLTLDRNRFEEIKYLVKKSKTATDFINFIKIKWHNCYKDDDEWAYRMDFELFREFVEGTHTSYNFFRNETNLIDKLRAFVDPFYEDSVKIIKVQNKIGPMEPVVFEDISDIYENTMKNSNWKTIAIIPRKILATAEKVIPNDYSWMKVLAFCIEAPVYSNSEFEEKPVFDFTGQEVDRKYFPKRLDKTKLLPLGRYAVIVQVKKRKNMYIF